MTTTTATTTAATPAPVAMTGSRNPKDSMKSTWRKGDKKQWTIFHWLYEILDIQPSYLDKDPPVHDKKDKVPFVPAWLMHRWILYHAGVPLVLHQLYAYFYGNMGPITTVIYYSTVFKLIGIHQLKMLRRVGYKYGFLDGDKHERDGIPDIGVMNVALSLVATVVFRMILAVVLSYNVSQTPLQMNWLALPVEIGLYGVVLDFWFYWYHRVMHQFDNMWKYHRTHHLTKHPNPLLTLYADPEQEFFDIIGIPLLTWLSLRAIGLPMSFYEWWLCHQYVVFSELTGHSGVRVHAETPSPVTPLLKMFDAELVIEDHDLHHRKGWRKSHNYGKQTRLWDRIFGTCTDRIESVKENVDYENTCEFPLY
ncbi:hypothetical protein FH972_022821 [Carpinus fangiana]|uniref:Fatty acid hydroxylase domain-containing protein n=1 Tax=Carpinus fangiana TaxID=176857 RepID=A0A5N6KTW3_9ROSI|nr:hypothetical protein FH972_022821 [Carpinus fangiana]